MHLGHLLAYVIIAENEAIERERYKLMLQVCVQAIHFDSYIGLCCKVCRTELVCSELI